MTDLLKRKIGSSHKEMDITMFNINSNPIHHDDCPSYPTTHIEYLDTSMEFFGKLRKQLRMTPEENRDSVVVPFWLSPNGSRMLFGSTKLFNGDTYSEKEYKNMHLYTTNQILARWSSSDICASLDSKLFYDELGTNPPETLIGGGYHDENIQYCKSRGIFIETGNKTQEICRYMATYKMKNGKNNVVFICGDRDFVGGSIDIFKAVNIASESLMAYNDNTLRKGINLSLGSINNTIKNPYNETFKISPEADHNFMHVYLSTQISLLLSGACMLHDYLCILRDFFGVESLIETSIGRVYNKIDINDIIDDYAKVKKYTVVARSLSAIA